jgi:hypothetical protein
MKLVAVILDDGELDRILAHEGWPVEFPKTRRYQDFRSCVCAGPEGSRSKPSRSPPAGRLSADADGQIDPRSEKWDGRDDVVPDEQPA